MFAERLKRIREKRGMSQAALAKALNVSQGTIGNWETGKRTPDADMLKTISQFFKVTVDELIGNTPELETETPTDSPETIENYINSFRTPAERKAVREMLEILPQLSLEGISRVYQCVSESQFVPGCMKPTPKSEDKDDGLTLIAARGDGVKYTKLKKREGAGSIFDAPDYKGGKK